jgi:hypothetical protein
MVRNLLFIISVSFGMLDISSVFVFCGAVSKFGIYCTWIMSVIKGVVSQSIVLFIELDLLDYYNDRTQTDQLSTCKSSSIIIQ